MDTLSHVITPNLLTLHGRCSFGLSHTNPRLHSLITPRVANKVRVFAELNSQNTTTPKSIDFSDPHWKTKFKEDFEARFRPPHVTDIFPDAPSMPSTFCLKMRSVGQFSWFLLDLLPLHFYCVAALKFNYVFVFFFFGLCVTELLRLETFPVIIILRMRSGMDILMTMTECFLRQYAYSFFMFV